MADQNRNQQSDQNDDETTGMDQSQLELSNREPASTADYRGIGSEPGDMSGRDSESLESEGIESDLDSETDVDEDVEGGSNR